MRVLDRYIISEFLRVFFICMTGFILVFLLVELTDKLKYYFRYNPPPWLMVKYFLVKIPGYLFFVVPLSILLGGMLSLFLMARNSELVAIQAGGIDAISIARPLLLVGLFGSLAMFIANETVIPWSNRYSEYIQDVEIAKKADRTFFKRDQIWMRSPTSITNIQKYDVEKRELQRVSIVEWDARYNFRQRIHAERARWWDDHWMLHVVNRTRKLPDGSFVTDDLPSLRADLSQTPDELGRVERLAREMNLMQLGRYIDKVQESGYSAARYLVDWHDKIAFPFVCLIMAALSVPFAVKVNPRGGGPAPGLAVSIVIAFTYWIVHTLFIALGHGGYMPALPAAWAPNLIFGFGSAVLLLHAGT